MSIAFVFPGQGSQAVGMGRDLYEASPAARAVFDLADAALGLPVARLCFEGPEAELTATENAQPALLATSVALLAAVAEQAGQGGEQPWAAYVAARAAFVAGHSLGEYAALVAGGALDLATALRLVRRRGELMAQASEGTMAAVIGGDEESIEACCREATEGGDLAVIANYNAPGQLVISGTLAGVERAGALARERGAKRVIPLKVSAAFHSPLMHAAAAGLRPALEAAPVADARTPVVANVTAAPLTSAGDIRAELAAQVTAPVRWIASVQQMSAAGVATFVEVGPGAVLSGLIKRIAAGAELASVSDAAGARALAQRGEP